MGMVAPCKGYAYSIEPFIKRTRIISSINSKEGAVIKKAGIRKIYYNS